MAIVPATVQTLVKRGFTVNVEEGAGLESSFANKEYEAAGANVTNSANVYKSNILLKVLYMILLFWFVLCNFALLLLWWWCDVNVVGESSCAQ